VAEDIQENEDMINDHMEQLEKEIQKIRMKRDYDFATFLSDTYVQDRKFRLMFLRADRFDPQRAAKRLVLHMDHKLNLFGQDKLVKSITLDDLDQDDIKSVMAGFLQYLPIKDRTGRTVSFHAQSYHEYKECVNIVSLKVSTVCNSYSHRVSCTRTRK